MLSFTPSKPLTMGAELELPLRHARDGALSRGATDWIAVLH